MRDFSELGATVASEGPQALFDQLEELLPEGWRDQIVAYPLAAMALGFGVGMFLGMRKGDEIIAAAGSMIAAAATANLGEVLGRNEEG